MRRLKQLLFDKRMSRPNPQHIVIVGAGAGRAAAPSSGYIRVLALTSLGYSPWGGGRHVARTNHRSWSLSHGEIKLELQLHTGLSLLRPTSPVGRRKIHLQLQTTFLVFQ